MTMKMLEENGIYRHPDYIGETKQLKDGSSTLLEMLANVTKKQMNNDFLGTIVENKLVYDSYLTCYNKAIKIGKFLRNYKQENEDNKESENDSEVSNETVDKSKRKDIDIPLGFKDIIGIFSVNRADWILSEYGIYISNSTNCPLYSTFGAESIRYILEQTGMRICFISGQKAESLYNDVIFENCFNLKMLICYDSLSDELEENYKKRGVEVFYLKDIIGEETNAKEIKKVDAADHEEGSYEVCERKEFIELKDLFNDLPTLDDVATICYTSGTSGKPKGVILTHLNFMSAVIGLNGANGHNEVFKIAESDVYISYLPLAHVMERVCISAVISAGAKIGFFRGNPKILQQDMKIVKPTFLVGVPRVFNVFNEKIEEEINKKPFLVRMLVKAAIKYKTHLQKSGKYTHWFLDKIIFDKVKNEFGGKLRASMNGSAPLSGKVTSYLQAVLSIRLFQGYGQTEGTAANIVMTTDNYGCENVGIPFPTNLVKLVPTEDYTGGMKGEIYLKGNNITKGYFKREDLNEHTFDDGWLKTGDIGCIEDGVFKIIGRRKEIFKTSLGEYIIPEKIENILKGGAIEDVLITGRSEGDFIVALVVCKDKNIGTEEILKKITEVGEKAFKDGKLTRFEIPRKVHLLRDDFDNYGEMMTPTMKKKRTKIEEFFKAEIDSLYSKN